MENKGADKRKYTRVNSRFIVSYRLSDQQEIREVSQTKDISAGGLALTTDIQFNPDTKLALKIRIPTEPNPIDIIGRVIDSTQLGKGVYNTRIEFVSIDDKYRNSITNIITHQLNKR